MSTLTVLLLLVLTAGCAPTPVPVLPSGQPTLVINWPQELRSAGERQDLAQLDAKEPAQVLQEELSRQLRAKGQLARIEARPDGQALKPFAGAQPELVLDTTLERLELRRNDSGSTSMGMGLGTGRFGIGVWQPLGGRDFDNLCAVAEVQAVLQNARTGDILLANLYRDSSCRQDAGTGYARALTLETLGREALIKAVGRLAEAMDKLFY